jgi:hypothetical protein
MTLAHVFFWLAGGAGAVFILMMFAFFGGEIIQATAVCAFAVGRWLARLASWPVRFVRYRSGHGRHSYA